MQKSKTWVSTDSMHADHVNEADDSLPFSELIEQMSDQLAAAHRTQSSTLASGHASAQRALEAGHEEVSALVARCVESMRQVSLENTMLRAQLTAMAGRSSGKDMSAGADAAAGSQQHLARDLKEGAFSSVLPFAPPAAPTAAHTVVPPKQETLPGMVDEGKENFNTRYSVHSMPGTLHNRNMLAAKRASSGGEPEEAAGETSDAGQGQQSNPTEARASRKSSRRSRKSCQVGGESEIYHDSDSDSSVSCCEAPTQEEIASVPAGRRTTRFDLPARKSPTMSEEEFCDRNSDAQPGDEHKRDNQSMMKRRFEVHKIWNKDTTIVGMERKSKRAHRNKALIKAATRALIGNQIVGDTERNKCLSFFMVSPGSPFRAMWDTLSLILVLYDIGSIPLVLLDPPVNDFSRSMAWTTRIFWSLDIPVSFCTGYLKVDGTVELCPGKVIRNYLRTWFLLDVLLVSVDWAEILFEGAGNAAQVGRASRTFRVLRMIRLMRLVRMREIVRVIQARIRSERIIILVDIVKIMAGIAAVAHFIACCWYGIGKSGEPDKSWIVAKSIDLLSLEEAYLTSLHWSISQFHGGMDEIAPQGLRERVFAVVVFLFAWMVAAAFVSGLTSEMTRLHILSSHQSRQLNVLHRYLRQSNVSDKLSLRVMRNAQHAISEQQRLMPESEVDLLRHVSEPLRLELHFEMYGPVLEVHPFFEKYVYECPQVMRKVCHEAMSTLLIATGDVIFNAGEIPGKPKMYIVCSGCLEYIPYNGQVVQVHSEMWMSEGALWTKWMHRGVLKTTMEGRLCLLDSQLFQDIVGCFDHIEFDPRRYAGFYVDELNEKLMTSPDSITDLPMNEEEKIALKTCDQSLRPSAIGRASEKLQKMIARRRSAFMDPNSSRRAMQQLIAQNEGKQFD